MPNTRLRASVLAAMMTCGVVHAQQAAVDVNIDAQPLDKALNAWAAQTGYQVLTPVERSASGRTAPSVKGRYTPESALKLLLASEDLRYQFVNARTVAIRQATYTAAARQAADQSMESQGPLALAQSHPRGEAVAPTEPSGADPSQNQNKDGVQQVLVTAQRRTERIQDVPFAITAIGKEEIRERGSSDIKDLQYSVPGLNIQELQPGANRTTMRGINPGISTGLPIVAVYVDEVGVNMDQQQRDGVFPLVDIDRIEVLRGPQGTLYGQGSIAGTIRYITRNPDLNKTDGFIEANAYSQEDGEVGYRAHGAVGLPLIDNRVGLRISAGYDQLAGWIDYPAANLRNVNETERTFVRPKLFAHLTDDLTLTLLYQYFDQKSDSDAVSGVASPAVRPGKTRLYPASDRSHLINGILSYDLGPVTLMSSSGYQQRDLEFTAAIATFTQDSPGEYEQFSQELRVSSNGEGRLQYTSGVWYRKFESDVNRIFFDANGNPTAVARKQGNDPVDSESKAIFGDVTFAATDKVGLSVGGRYYSDTRDNTSTIPLLNNEADFSSFSPRGSLRYSWTPDVSTYATISKGFRSGGFNNSGTNYGPESLWNYEVGTKAIIARTFFIDFAGYYLDYKDRQTQTAIQTAPGVFFSETRSVGKASGFGVEGAVGAQLGAGFRLDVTGAYNDIRSDVTNTEVVKGERFGFVPRFTGSVALSQRIPLGSAMVALWRLDFQHASSYSSIIRQGLANGSVAVLENLETQPQDYLNARFGIEFSKFQVLLDAQNLLNEDSILFPFSPITTTNEGVRARPRSYGIMVRRDFGG
jgi:iron complex outermembrane recepter protein